MVISEWLRFWKWLINKIVEIYGTLCFQEGESYSGTGLIGRFMLMRRQNLEGSEDEIVPSLDVYYCLTIILVMR